MFATRLVIFGVLAFALAFSAPSVPAQSLELGASNGSRVKQSSISVYMKVISCGINNECYRVDIAVGTPLRTFRVTLDNTILYQSLHLFSSTMPAPNSTCKSTDIHRNRFDPSSSATYVPNGESQAEGGGKPPYEDVSMKQ